MTGEEQTPVIRVVDVTTGPAVAGVLSEAGAAVIRVEHPEAGIESSAGSPVEWPAAGSTVIRHLDLTCGPDRDDLLVLVREARVFVESWKPGFAAMLGYGFEDLAAVNPALVYVSVEADPGIEAVRARLTGVLRDASTTNGAQRFVVSDQRDDPR